MLLSDLSAIASKGDLELIVDLSNVCKNRDLDETGEIARWDRLLRVLELWNSWPNGFERPVVLLVADKNLRYSFGEVDLALFKQAVKDGYIVEHEKADPVLLELAEQTDCVVISNDNFVGYRRRHPWMEAAPARFVQIRTGVVGTRLELLALPKRTGFSKSRAEEQDHLKELRIDLKRDLGAGVLSIVYRCRNQACIRQAFAPEGAAVPPKIDPSGSVVCPGCNEPLAAVGHAKRSAVVKLTSALDGRTDYFALEAGAAVTIGRSNSDVSLDGLLSEESRGRLSRRHLQVDFDGDRIAVTDLRSSNGSMLSRWSKAEQHLGEPTLLTPDTAELLRPRDSVSLAGLLTVERSGRRFPFDVQPALQGGRVAADAPKTVVRPEGGC